MWAFETARIGLRELMPSDEEALVALHSDPEVMRYLTDGQPEHPDRTRSVLRMMIEQTRAFEGRLGYWAAIEKTSGRWMGWFHLRPGRDDPESSHRVELGYRLACAFWGRGYATEGSQKLVEHGFQTPGVTEIFAQTMEGNQASRRVMEKAGLRFVRTFHHPGFPESEALDVEYVLKRNQSV